MQCQIGKPFHKYVRVIEKRASWSPAELPPCLLPSRSLLSTRPLSPSTASSLDNHTQGLPTAPLQVPQQGDDATPHSSLNQIPAAVKVHLHQSSHQCRPFQAHYKLVDSQSLQPLVLNALPLDQR